MILFRRWSISFAPTNSPVRRRERTEVYRWQRKDGRKVNCPECGSDQLFADKKGFGAGKALAGALLTGGIGLLAGFVGSSQIYMTCLACGHRWELRHAAQRKADAKKEVDNTPSWGEMTRLNLSTKNWDKTPRRKVARQATLNWVDSAELEAQVEPPVTDISNLRPLNWRSSVADSHFVWDGWGAYESGQCRRDLR